MQGKEAVLDCAVSWFSVLLLRRDSMVLSWVSFSGMAV